MSQGYDLIGDIHGCGKTLVTLLKQMGYSQRQGIYQHPKRKVVFLGDIVDRGPNIRMACHVVRDMVDAGHAHIVMGNHEYNVLMYCTESPSGMQQPYLRPHTQRNTFIVQQTLEQFANHASEFREFLNWFADLPLFLDFDHFRVIHACWDQRMIDEYVRRYGGNRLRRQDLVESVKVGGFLHDFLDRSLRGTALKLPDNRFMLSKDGLRREFFRTKFWAQQPQHYGDVVFQPDPLPDDIEHALLSPEEKEQLLFYGRDEKPLFIGHYWMSGLPEPIVPNIACLDYSAVKYGRLAAYRMDQERVLQRSKFTWVRVEKGER